MKKKYERPKMRIVKTEQKAAILCDSGSNSYWCNEQPKEDEWWSK